jgi:aquaporin Z
MAGDTPAAHHVRRPHLHFPHIHFTRRELHDRPLAGVPLHRWHPRLYACEAAATALLMVLGITAVTLLTAPGSPLAHRLAAHPMWQTSLCGLLFGSAGTAAAMTPFGRVSGAHLSPSVSLAFGLAGKLAWPDLLGYVAAQIIGAIAGTALVWAAVYPFTGLAGQLRSVHYAATLPAAGVAAGWVVAAELVATAGLVLALAWGAAHKRLHLLTPWIGGLYFFAMNPLVAWVSGDSTNFARTLGPALFDGHLAWLWIYLLGPLAGSALAMAWLKSGALGRLHLAEARLINFGHHGRVPRLSAPEAVGPPPSTVSGAPS